MKILLVTVHNKGYGFEPDYCVEHTISTLGELFEAVGHYDTAPIKVGKLTSSYNKLLGYPFGNPYTDADYYIEVDTRWESQTCE